ncbi:Diadenosine tetraphosphate (Ap4A) hydrolase [Mesobacillus persicus]|uniref:Diadenosine tetraphosphate (Ap4A) hydrolase n=1 Tax=Mesobacillus persicus TaxID=930146 RepID=A0A1H8D111_9BACI|nr:Diadenosine tetraphosphate (Ap4A) hydrolase [Mesobacillus persicus]
MFNMSCPFCSNNLNILKENDLAYAIYDKYPVNKGHVLIIPKRHVSNYFQCRPEERAAMDCLLFECREMLQHSYSPEGFNVGINCGEAAGQTIFHVHVHLIPRFKGDMDDPRGGVRGVIPDKRVY